MLGKTLDGEFKLLHIRELDNNNVDGRPDSTDEDSPPNLSIVQRVVVQCGADIGCIGWNTSQCVMQKSVVYWKWPNVVDIYCKRADAIKQTD